METQPCIRIAIADDHAATREGFKLILESFNNCTVVIQAEDGNSLVEKLRYCIPAPDLCIVDIRMPFLDGYETLKAIKIEWPSLKVILQSALDDEQNVIRAFKYGASAFLSKRSELPEIRKAIYETHENGAYYSPWVSKNIIPKLSSNDNLTERDIELIRYACDGLTHSHVAQKIHKGERTVDHYYAELNKKLKVHNNIELVVFALRAGIVY